MCGRVICLVAANHKCSVSEEYPRTNLLDPFGYAMSSLVLPIPQAVDIITNVLLMLGKYVIWYPRLFLSDSIILH
jgi:hypothetical protein